MEMALRAAHSPLCSRSRPVLVVRPATAAAGSGFVQPIVRCSRFTRSRHLRYMVASSDYSKKNPRRASTPKPKGAASRTYAPRPTVESSTKKIEQSSTSEGDFGRSNGKLSSEATGQTSNIEESSEVNFYGNVSSSASLEGADSAFEGESEEEGGQNLSPELSPESMDDDALDRKLDEYRGKISALINSKPDPTSISSTYVQDRSIVRVPEQSKPSDDVIGQHPTEERTVTSGQGITEESPEGMISKSVEGEQLSREAKETLLAEDDLGITMDEQDEPDIASIQDGVDPQVLMRQLEELAEKNYSAGNNCFVFPEVGKADSIIDLYLNRSMSALANDSNVLIKGAFNGWRWKSFTEKLRKSDLRGDWWCCKLHIPKQAYRLDFVFFNGDTIYENNNYNDFALQIESDMDEQSFEDFLVEEKQRELERLAAEEAERVRQAEEERRKAEERAEMEADKAQAKAEVEMNRNKLQSVLSSASRYADNLWYIEPSTYKAGDRVKLFYNRSSRPLMHNTEIWMHGGYNNWSDGLSISERLVKSYEKDGDWWYADVTLPERALMLDWVFADGPPGNARNYDNNGRKDFHAIVPNNISKDLFWVEEEHIIFRRLQKERKEREEADRRKAEVTGKIKAEMKEKTMREFLLSQKHIVYTEPLEVRAGTTVDVLYNPSNTVLNGKPEVWFRCSFNRWTHPSGPLPPQKMVSAENGSHLRATVRVPLDAYMMDFVFSESEEGGIYDNRNGMDYHIPVSDSVAKEPPMHIVHIAVEMAPIAKVGGLGDVVTSLSRAVQDLGHNVEVILPKYDCLNLSNVKDLHLRQSFIWGNTEIKVWFGKVEDVPVYFLEPQNGMFWVGCVYGRNDESRFGFFCHSALEFLRQNGSSPDIIHCHDWSSAPVAWLFKEQYAHNDLSNGRVVFTIHNLEFGAHHIGKAMANCDKATTVSYTYSREVSGHGAIAPHYYKFHGIRNGIDPDIWDPYSDNFIPVHYTSENVVEGKSAAKKALQQKLGLQQTDTPIVGIISRLTVQKGIHLIKHAIYRTLERNGQVVLLGSAPDHRIQGDFTNLASKLHGEYHGRVKLCLTYDEPLSHLIYAGADFILVPSIFEPCGLTQLIAMRYGSIPIVRKTGGLYDTVFDIDDDKDRAQEQGLEPNGFSFEGADSNGVDYALDRQSDHHMVRRPRLVPLPLQEGDGARLDMEPTCSGLHGIVPFRSQELKHHWRQQQIDFCK
uniref:starch synthase n=1 Tax=Leersia perrieri TaxID=77586 RepID=A0A0D9W9R4_9ORYZ